MIKIKDLRIEKQIQLILQNSHFCSAEDYLRSRVASDFKRIGRSDFLRK